MANLSIAALLVALILAGVFLAPEPFVDPGTPVARMKPDKKTCFVEIHEDDTSKRMDVKCGPTTKALHAEGIYQRSGVSLLDNGRLRRKACEGPDPSNCGDDHVCTLLMSDDLVQYDGKYNCDNENPNLYEGSSDHDEIISNIERNGPYCEISFKSTVEEKEQLETNEKIKKYIDFLSGNAAAVVVSRRYSGI